MHLKNLRIRGGLILGKENINIKYEHQNNSNYLVIEDNVEYDDYQYKMLRRNKPEHFLRRDYGWIQSRNMRSQYK